MAGSEISRFQLSAAAFVNRQDFVREFLPDLENFTTLVTPIIVKWHILFLLNL